jgi:hypothetical protein
VPWEVVWCSVGSCLVTVHALAVVCVVLNGVCFYNKLRLCHPHASRGKDCGYITRVSAATASASFPPCTTDLSVDDSYPCVVTDCTA